MNKQIFSRESDTVMTVIGKLTNAGMDIERVGEDAYNVISRKTGAVLKRLVNSIELSQYVTCAEYVARTHKEDIEVTYKYTRPVHGV